MIQAANIRSRNIQDLEDAAVQSAPSRSRRIGLLLVLLGCIVSWTPAFHQGRFCWDFLPVYSGARCMVQGCDPYSTGALLRNAAAAGVEPAWAHKVMVVDQNDSVYPPPSLFLLTPFGAMRWKWARSLWLALTGLGFAVACWLVWDLCAGAAPVLAGFVLGLAAASGTIYMMGGNITGLALSLCVGGVYCFLREKRLMFGAVCLGLSLLLKPQLGGLVWLYLLLASPLSRRFALRTLAVAAVLGIPGLVWMSLIPAAHHWPSELHAAIAAAAGPGGNADPGLQNPASYDFLNLRALFSAVTPDPGIASLLSWTVAGTMLVIWLVAVLRNARTQGDLYLGLAATAALTLLPVYHRHYDSRLLLLAMPAAFLLWRDRGPKRWLALVPALVLMVLTAHSLVVRIGVWADGTVHGPWWLRLAGRVYPAMAFLAGCIYLGLLASEALRPGHADSSPVGHAAG